MFERQCSERQLRFSQMEKEEEGGHCKLGVQSVQKPGGINQWSRCEEL